jgi:large conductance mechanosensitive channel
MLKEFKEFATKGNIMDLAVGVVIGGAFQSIVTSLVEDIIMPAISAITGKVDFSDMYVKVGDATIKYGNFITAIVNFLIIAFSIFLVVTYLNKLNKKMESMKFGEEILNKVDKKGKLKKNKKSEEEKPAEPTVKVCPYCFSEISYKATRCPHCTTILAEELKKKIEVNKKEEVKE